MSQVLVSAKTPRNEEMHVYTHRRHKQQSFPPPPELHIFTGSSRSSKCEACTETRRLTAAEKDTPPCFGTGARESISQRPPRFIRQTKTELQVFLQASAGVCSAVVEQRLQTELGRGTVGKEETLVDALLLS